MRAQQNNVFLDSSHCAVMCPIWQWKNSKTEKRLLPVTSNHDEILKCQHMGPLTSSQLSPAVPKFPQVCPGWQKKKIQLLQLLLMMWLMPLFWNETMLKGMLFSAWSPSPLAARYISVTSFTMSHGPQCQQKLKWCIKEHCPRATSLLTWCATLC